MYAGTSQNCCRTPCKACLQYTVMFYLKFLNLHAVLSRSGAMTGNVPIWVVSAAARCMPGYRQVEKDVTATLLPSRAAQGFETVTKSAQENSKCTPLYSAPPYTLLCYALMYGPALWSSPTLLALVSRSQKEHLYPP